MKIAVNDFFGLLMLQLANFKASLHGVRENDGGGTTNNRNKLCKPPAEIQKNTTVYKIDTIDVDGKPEVQFKCLKRLVGERGFEPPTPWSRTMKSQIPSALSGVA